jgi:hypothetical protein
MTKILGGKRPLKPSSTEIESVPLIWNLMQQCWSEHPHDRPPADEVLRQLDPQHPDVQDTISPRRSVGSMVDSTSDLHLDHPHNKPPSLSFTSDSRDLPTVLPAFSSSRKRKFSKSEDWEEQSDLRSRLRPVRRSKIDDGGTRHFSLPQ